MSQKMIRIIALVLAVLIAGSVLIAAVSSLASAAEPVQNVAQIVTYSNLS